MNFQLNEYDKEVLSIQDGLKIDEFEKQKILGLIQQTEDETREIQLKTNNLRYEYSVLIDKKQNFLSKLELYNSLSDKLKNNIQRVVVSLKAADKSLLIAQSNLDNAIKEFEQKLISKKSYHESKISNIEEIIQNEIKSNDSVIKKIILYRNKLQAIETAEKTKSELVQEILNQKLKNDDIWLTLKKNIIKIASEYVKNMNQNKSQENEIEPNKNLLVELNDSVSTIISSSLIYNETKDPDLFVKPIGPIWSHKNKIQKPIRESGCLTSTPLTKIVENDEANFEKKQIDYESNCFQTPTILIPKLNVTLTPIPRKSQKYTKNIQMSINKFQITEQLETLDEEPLSNNFLNSKFGKINENQNSNYISSAFDCDKSINSGFMEVENSFNNFPDLQFGFKDSYLNNNKKPLDSLNLFKE